MKVKELIEQLQTISPDAEVVLFEDGEKPEVGGISVCDNDDDDATEIAICSKETMKAFSSQV